MALPNGLIFADEGYLYPRYPLHIARAFVAVTYDDRNIDDEDDRPYPILMQEAVISFEQRWGGLDDATFLRVFHEGKGGDKLIAIFAIGSGPLAQASDLLALLLQSPDLLERCAAACCLGLRKDERALPVLEEYLLQDPPLDPSSGHYVSESVVWYMAYRSVLSMVLATWGPDSMTPILRQAFIRIWEQDKLYQPGESEFHTHDALCYALGRRGALGALHGIDLPPNRRRLAMLYLALGYVKADERFDNIISAVTINDSLRQEVVSVFEAQFGLSPEESQAVLDARYDDNRKREYWWEAFSEDDETSSEGDIDRGES
ncbi:HEAT repeat domain-containing protein [Ktedonospora formicarum]|uniref:Uncharacterized protein n=1 Tax=Ktedonospora formicarum TaxID=2778364 RepID=A0A8J3IAH5_9CHLR|nr:HEAT repeat domain-containing protein [Ktedonospora formicarum]GHO48469.1 hypothetical protein KSX_66320 [Ktedonospora formicarum]